MSERACWNCKYAGCDPDGPYSYCAAPRVTAQHKWGLALSSSNLAQLCPAPEHPLFELKEEPLKPISTANPDGTHGSSTYVAR